MKITKYGHCCLLIEHKGKRILTDPGGFSTGFTELEKIDLILITHEHGDHLHTDALKEVLAKNPDATVVTNTGVGKLLTENDIPFTVLEGTDATELLDMHLSAHDGKHEEIIGEYGQVQNTGYFIDEHLFYPGDSFTNPEKKVPVLALPVAGPWCKVADALHYALAVKPTMAFPVHDGLLNENGLDLNDSLFGNQLPQADISFKPLRSGDSLEC